MNTNNFSWKGLALLLLSTSSLCAQTNPYSVVFKRDYGPTQSSQQFTRNVMQTRTGEIVVVGVDLHYGSSDTDVMLRKYHANGDLIWSKVLVGSLDQEGFCVTETQDGKYVIAGYKDATSAYRTAFITQTDSSGTELWTKETKAFSTTDGFYDVVSTLDSNIVCTGKLSDRLVIYKFDNDGNLIFARKYNGGQKGNSIIEDENENLIVVGPNFDNTTGYILKTDKNGMLLWSKTMNTPGWDSAADVIETIDNEYIVLGTSDANDVGNRDVAVSKIDQNGVEVWSKTYGTSTSNELGISIVQNDEGQFYVLGTQNYRVRYLKLDAFGSIIWNTEVATSDFMSYGTSNSLILTTDNGILAAGSTGNGWSGAEHVSLLKTDSSGYNPCYGSPAQFVENSLNSNWQTDLFDTLYSTYSPIVLDVGLGTYTYTTDVEAVACYEEIELGIIEAKQDTECQISPNPTSGKVTVYFTAIQQNLAYEITDMTGRIVNQGTLNNVDHFTINTWGAPGYYMFSIYNGETRIHKRILKE